MELTHHEHGFQTHHYKNNKTSTFTYILKSSLASHMLPRDIWGCGNAVNTLAETLAQFKCILSENFDSLETRIIGKL